MERYLNASEAAARLGVSAKALRLYEQRGLLTPPRTDAGWRAYGPAEMARAGEIAALRALGLSLSQTARVLAGDAAGLEPALAAHQAALEGQGVRLAETINRIKVLRADLRAGRALRPGELASLITALHEPAIALDLPWPWGGERFELPALAPLTWLVGPLGSGKTRLATALAEAIPGGRFVGLDRTPAEVSPRVGTALDWLVGEGATRSDALIALMSDLAADDASLIVDLVEQGLDQPTQEALAAWLRRRPAGAAPLILMTRSSAMLDLEAVGPVETLILCPANHSPPVLVAPHVGAPGYEALAGCLATPAVRARTQGMRATMEAWRPSIPRLSGAGRDPRSRSSPCPAWTPACAGETGVGGKNELFPTPFRPTPAARAAQDDVD